MEQLQLGLAVRIERFPLAKSRKRNERNDLPAHNTHAGDNAHKASSGGIELTHRRTEWATLARERTRGGRGGSFGTIGDDTRL